MSAFVPKFKCNVCGKKLQSSKSLEYHMRYQHLGEKPYSCDHCDESFTFQEHLKRHMKDVHPDKVITCDVCCKVFLEAKKLEIHKLAHTDDNRKSGRRKATDYSIFKYIQKPKSRKKRKELEEAFIERIISKINKEDSNVAQKPEHLENQGAVVNNTEMNGDSTGINNHSPSLKSSNDFLSRRINLSVPPGTSYKCDACNKMFTTKNYLDAHMKIHNPETTTFLCDYCPKKFASEMHLQCHMRTHRQCEFCDKVLTGIKTYRKHVFEVHSKPSTRPGLLTCQICRVKMSSHFALTNHVRSQHQMGEPLRCEECGYVFHGYGQLRAHVKKNHPDKAYSCDVCPWFSLNPKSLRDHKLRHADASRKSSREKDEIDYEIFKYSDPQKRKAIQRSKEGRMQNYDLKGDDDVNDTSESNNLEKADEHTVMERESSKTDESVAPLPGGNLDASSKQGNNLRCDKCNQILPSKKALQSHMEGHSTPTIRCDYCPRMFSTHQQLKGHTVSSHTHCKLCDKIIDGGRKNYREHYREVHSRLERPEIIPDECCLAFQSNLDLRQHYRERHPDQYFFCQVCDDMFYKEALIRSHCITAHPPPQQLSERSFQLPIYTCEKCHEIFLNLTNFLNHVKLKDCSFDEDLSQSNGVKTEMNSVAGLAEAEWSTISSLAQVAVKQEPLEHEELFAAEIEDHKNVGSSFESHQESFTDQFEDHNNVCDTSVIQGESFADQFEDHNNVGDTSVIQGESFDDQFEDHDNVGDTSVIQGESFDDQFEDHNNVGDTSVIQGEPFDDQFEDHNNVGDTSVIQGESFDDQFEDHDNVGDTSVNHEEPFDDQFEDDANVCDTSVIQEESYPAQFEDHSNVCDTSDANYVEVGSLPETPLPRAKILEATSLNIWTDH